MNLMRKSQRFLLRRICKTFDLHQAKRSLLSSPALSDQEKALLDRVSLKIHGNDELYVPFHAQHYLSVGLSALRCIEEVLNRAKGDRVIRPILDFPCGYGRILRFLRARFPDADITGAELNRAALDFCRRTFSVRSLVSDTDFTRLSLSDKFDLIWCGSLFTHVDEKAATALLKFFQDHLTPVGLCVFTTHGLTSVDRIQEAKKTYGLPVKARQELLSQFREHGYGYADYPDQNGYGVSVVSHERMLALAESAGNWHEVVFGERAWDSHQDVYGFVNAE
ncbi:MAG: class I SAM-dependent methyltransferase [Deltaproteobacteria bacterium]|nr:class I SAM-dependent methyltransferase [Deltaproteobacteria bacterium]